MATSEQAYVPGMCNINKAEIAYRKKAMIAGFLVAVILFGGMMLVGLNSFLRAVVVALPLFAGVIGYLQVKNRFCVGYAASGKQNAEEGNDKALEVAEATAKAADKKKARMMNLQASIITLAVLVLSLVVPAL